jgi:hypothetical protein
MVFFLLYPQFLIYKSEDPSWVHFLPGLPANGKQRNPLGLLPTMSPHISAIFFLFPRSMADLLNLNTIRRHDKKLKSHQRFFPCFYFFQIYHFSQAHWCESPFKKRICQALPQSKFRIQNLCGIFRKFSEPGPFLDV